MKPSDPNALSDEELVDHGAALEAELHGLRAEILVLGQNIASARRKNIKPGIKLALSAGTAVAGVVLAPITFSASLAATIVGLGLVGWDLSDFGSEIQALIVMSDRDKRLRRRVQIIARELAATNDLLDRRFGEP